MHYVMGDIHNENQRLQKLLREIRIEADDTLYLLGDLFDRGGEAADPVGVYFTVLGLGARCVALRGNHDEWLAQYIERYAQMPERKRKKCKPYGYNSFELLKEQLTMVDMLGLVEFIRKMPLQAELSLDGQRYLLAHAMTSPPLQKESMAYYLMGSHELEDFLQYGIEGYISLVGHTPSDNGCFLAVGRYLDEKMNSIWTNDRENVFMMDCGSGFGSGRLACLCLETGERFYA